MIQIVFNNKQKLVSFIILFVKKDGYDREPWKVKFVGITYSGLKFMFFLKKKLMLYTSKKLLGLPSIIALIHYSQDTFDLKLTSKL